MAKTLPLDSSKFPSLATLAEYVKSITLTSSQINDEPTTRSNADIALDLKINTNVPDMVVFTSSELNNYSDDARYVRYDQGTKTFKQKGGSTRTPITGDWTLIKSIETLTASLNFPVGYDRGKIITDRHFEIPVGNKGSGEPYEIFIGGDNADCNFILDKDYTDLSLSLTDEQKRTVKNRGSGNRIILNNRQIFSGNRPIEFNSPVIINDPYIISQNGFSYPGFKLGSPANDCLFTDWWIAWGGLDIVGDGSILIPPVHNPFSGPLQYKVFSDDPAGRFLRYNTPIGGSTGVDPDVHSRTSPSTLATIATYTSSASNEISGIPDVDTIKLKIGARVFDAGGSIPQKISGTPKTTIIKQGGIVHNGPDNNSIFLIDSETGGDVIVSATGNLTIDMSGNSGISHQMDAAQQITGRMLFGQLSTADFWGKAIPYTGALKKEAPTGAVDRTATNPGQQGLEDDLVFDNSFSTLPNIAKINPDETRVISNQRHSYLIM
jgi:hypothetical protein